MKHCNRWKQRGICTAKRYKTLVIRKCRKTCGMCTTTGKVTSCKILAFCFRGSENKSLILAPLLTLVDLTTYLCTTHIIQIRFSSPTCKHIRLRVVCWIVCMYVVSSLIFLHPQIITPFKWFSKINVTNCHSWKWILMFFALAIAHAKIRKLVSLVKILYQFSQINWIIYIPILSALFCFSNM